MRILSMTATFGKLEHETLTLEPGLNIVEAPNEWGKSTWCAFLTAMLYGVDTRAKSTRAALADKERYAPWSGSPMSGRMEIEWNGRHITIERHTKGRIPMGEFRAYETESGLPVPELTGVNCGEILLGVERSVFLRAGFIRLSDLPVTQDEALRSRLNALVTTGDESGDAERLARGLKELKNKCRYNRTGLIPQTESERAALEEKLRTLTALEEQRGKLESRLAQVNDWIAALENHRDALEYADAQINAGRVLQAREELGRARERLTAAETLCSGLPDREEAEWAVKKLSELKQNQLDLQMESQMIPEPQPAPEPPTVFRGMDGREAVETARADEEAWLALGKKSWPLLAVGAVFAAGGIAAAVYNYLVLGLAASGLGLALAVAALILRVNRRKKQAALEDRYGDIPPLQWVEAAESYAAGLEAAENARREYLALRGDLDQRLRQLREKIRRCTHNRELEESLTLWRDALAAWEEWADAHREHRRAENLLHTLESLAKPLKKPLLPDAMTYTDTETARLLSDALSERQQLSSRISQYRGRLEAMPTRMELTERLERLNRRLRELEDMYAALTIAQQALADAAAELQRRFAPHIAKRARELMEEMTAGRYSRLSLGEDLALRAGAEEEDTLRELLWRSDGTVDQLYLALRLAVAEVLTMDAPLILDDALVRFDDERLRAAMAILSREAQHKQVILFTCQSREKKTV